MDDLPLVERMVRTLVGGLSVPVTVKIRRFLCVKVRAATPLEWGPTGVRAQRLLFEERAVGWLVPPTPASRPRLCSGPAGLEVPPCRSIGRC